MSRPAIRELASRPFELLVIGAGIHGAFAALEASRRGYRVALIDSGDFGAATSANSMRVLHGGFRYLRTADLKRLRESARERAYLMSAAPHLTAPLPCAAPIGMGGMPGGGAFRAAFLAQGMLAPGRRRVGEAARVVSGSEYARLCGEYAVPGAAGGAVWYDGFMEGAERLLMNVIRSACWHGAIAANYVRCEALIMKSGTLHGAQVRDLHDGSTFELRADRVVNATGVCAPSLVGESGAMPGVRFVRGCNVIVRRKPPLCAVAVPSETGRMLFVVPFGQSTMLGTWYSSDVQPSQERAAPMSSDARALLAAFGQALPDLRIDMSEVTRIHSGYVPAEPNASPDDLSDALLDRALVIDHGSSGGVRGVITLIGVKWTTARAAALRAVRSAVSPLPRVPRQVPPDEPLHGTMHARRRDAASLPVQETSEATRAHLAAVYGYAAQEILRCAVDRPELLDPLAADAPTIGAEVVHAIRTEQALHLTDVLLRRAMVGLTEHPAPALVAAAAAVAANELDWNASTIADEIAAVGASYTATS